MTLPLPEYDKVVRKFVDDYVNNLTPDQLREIVHEQAHIDFENTRKDFGQIGVWEEMSGWDSDLFESISKEFNIPEDDWQLITDPDYDDHNPYNITLIEET